MDNGKAHRFAEAVRAASDALVAGGIGVMPTDTIYGLVGSALRRRTVERVYRLRKRDPKKPMIVLIAAPEDVWHFGAKLDARAKKLLRKVWPGKVSVILTCSRGKFSYLHRGTKALAFRVPKPAWLHTLLLKTGPLVAPSANREGEPPACTIREAKRYFGTRAAFYLDHGRLDGKPSALVQIRNGKIVVLRKGGATL